MSRQEKLWKKIGSKNYNTNNADESADKKFQSSEFLLKNQNAKTKLSKMKDSSHISTCHEENCPEESQSNFQIRIKEVHMENQLNQRQQTIRKEFSFCKQDQSASSPQQDLTQNKQRMPKTQTTFRKQFDDFNMKNISINVYLLKEDLNLFKIGILEELNIYKNFIKKIACDITKNMESELTAYKMFLIDKQKLEKIKQNIQDQRDQLRRQLNQSEEQNKNLMNKFDQTLEKYWKQFQDRQELKRKNIQLQNIVLSYQTAIKHQNIQTNFKSQRLDSEGSNTDKNSASSSHKITTQHQQYKICKKNQAKSSDCSTYSSMCFNSQNRRNIAQSFQSSLRRHHNQVNMITRSHKNTIK